MSGLQVFISSSMRACAKTVSWKVTLPVTSLCTSRDVATDGDYDGNNVTGTPVDDAIP